MLKKLYYLIPKNLRWRVFVLLFFMVTSAFVELISIGFIYPVLKIMMEKQINFDLYFGLTDKINNLLSQLNSAEIFLYPLIFLVFMYTLKTLFLIFFNYIVVSQTYLLSLKLTEKMFTSLKKKKNNFFLKNKSNYIVRIFFF